MKDLRNKHSLEQDCLAYFSTDEYKVKLEFAKRKMFTL